MGSLSTTCEISEVLDDMHHVEHSGKTSGLSVGHREGKLPVLRLGLKDSLEDDINQLFESFNLKNSSRISSPAHQIDGSPLRKKSLKKPITVGVPHSPRIGGSEPLTLKQALRDLCLSKASEVAAMRRLSKSSASPVNSEAGRIKNLYDAKVVETIAASSVHQGKGGSVLEILLVPEGSGSSALAEMSRQMDIPTASSSHSARVSEKSLSCSNQERVVQKDSNIPSSSSSVDKTRNPPVLKMKSSTQRAYSPRSLAVQLHREMEIIQTHDTAALSTVEKVTVKTLKEELVEQQENVPQSASLSFLNDNEGTAETHNNVSPAKNGGNKASASKPGRRIRLHNLHSSSSSVSGMRVGKSARTTTRIVKPARNKSSIKKKAKQDTDPAAALPNTEPRQSNPKTSQLICRRCQCSLESKNAESSQAPESFQLPEQTPENIQANNSRTAAVTAKPYAGSKDKGEFSQSSKSSIGEYSSSTTSISDESNISRSSCSNRPHMSKDIRWEAIRHVRRQSGVLGLTHFNLLKKLGSGDIGTVYLAELIGTNCLFAIKVMDNEFLARRKKLPRAQTEKEILRTLDHPFLPTLFAQFTSDNLSCLVMEYCPGGDLHVLRQRQPARRFTEPAARFYVAEVLLALEYLHMLGVVYRDLKPENILVREDGHIMLTDFDLSLRCTVSPTLLKSPDAPEPPKVSGTAPCSESTCAQPFCIEPSCRVPCFTPRFLPPNAKAGGKLKNDQTGSLKSLPQLVAEPTDARSNSFVGTHEYLAPEIIKGEGHGAAVDWWTFGIFLYELLYGKTPFKGSGNEETLANVVLQSLRFPDCQFVTFQAQDLIRGLLVKEPENRLGTEKGAAEIKQHPFFEGLNWALIRCAIPPELPDCFDFGVRYVDPLDSGSKYLECKATEEQLQFEVF
ncbi:hypothetical protein SAY87_020374 [Trapa incisa]|uniref:non-specific serine/threonine protein kinase n=1 Tax=Trapa incisa TaxID=236973 RepID=A0AAN7K0N4_9MYRT|nr:hypothetical protein SAY87_020374 [Trapa incisa]